MKMIKALLILLVSSQLSISWGFCNCNNATFPSNFKFGAGTSAYQIEGGWNVDGKGRSNWDYFMNTYPLLNSNVTGNVACDSYHKYKEDVAAMKEIGLDYYRFSLSWPRLLPKGFSNQVNQDGVDYYNNLLDELEAAGIEPLVTMYHWDTPLALEYLGSIWTSPLIVDYFVAYADLVFQLFGNRVKLWATINEPKSFCQAIPDFFHSIYFHDTPVGTLEYLCVHHVLLAHAKAYRLYEKKYKATQRGKISITLDLNWNSPASNSTEDQEAVDRKNAFDYGWIANPLVYGDYPQIMKDVIGNNSAKQNFSKSRLPEFSKEEKDLVKGAYDLFMLNHYTSYIVTSSVYNNDPNAVNDEQVSTSQPSDWPSTAVSGIAIYPWGLRHVLKYVKDTYNNPEIFITENGYNDLGGVNDTLRINFLRDYLQQILVAMCEDKVNVTRYTYWSLLDNLEWSRGFRIKFGLVDVDYGNANLTRTLKLSAYYYRKVIETHYPNSTV